ncbi:immunity 22 family protein [Domibacillus sp. DTU_2020_1001157_1_SI_ALB_TIR_016]|uniref:immunity 22 family protein n=1 Tax=Domibacillus sp. DTU_2020_1001157_1_SI_ALB_TIR_016 TaxID=3077789 RepID=UPI0028E29E78|nr:immunity 22 family protein [Domibacillus sp. DTU_2020_1001157_1_SI_ALB_TIR_016]WNS79228.1 immunity 22 family protein [Domibacillus sp. DTU_2020_1001157_1_SI_ALB_TIR_016]
MEQEGYVSLWVGNFSSNEELQKYLLNTYDEDGNAAASAFEEEYKIDDHDSDFREADCFKTGSRQLSILLSGCSYEDVVIPLFTEIQGEELPYSVNSIILLYNFKYSEKGGREPSHVHYLGSVRYK